MAAEANLKINVNFDAKTANTQIRQLQAYLRGLQVSAKSLTAELQTKQKQLSEVRGLMTEGGTASSMKEWADEESRLVAETANLEEQLAAVEQRTQEIRKNLIETQLNPQAIKKTDAIRQNMNRVTVQTDKVSGGFSKLFNRLKGLAATAFVFNVIRNGLTELRTSVGSLISSNDTLSASLARIKGNLLTAFQPIWEYVLPALQTLFGWLERLTSKLASFVAGIFGTTTEQAAKNANALLEQAKSIKKVAQETKKAERTLASFDTVNRLDNPESETGGSAGQEDPSIVFGQAASGLTQMGNSGNALSAMINNLFSALQPFSDWVFGELGPSLGGLLQNLSALFSKLWVTIKPWAEPLLQGLGDLVIAALNGISAAIGSFLGWLDEDPANRQLASSIILGLLAGFVTYETGKKVSSLISKIKTALSNLGTAGLSTGGKLMLAAAAIGILVAGIVYLASQWDKLTPSARVITILGALAAAATAAAIAVALFHTAWTVGIAAAAIAGGLALLGLTYAFSHGKASSTNAVVEDAESTAESFYNSQDFTRGFQLPGLAQGAVLPPNKPFAAIVGDQRNGTNIEAPLSTIVEAFNAALDSRGADNVTLTVNGDLAGLFHYLNINIEKEKRRASAF